MKNGFDKYSTTVSKIMFKRISTYIISPLLETWISLDMNITSRLNQLILMSDKM